MNISDAEEVIFQCRSTLIPEHEVMALLQSWEDAYPEDCFPSDGTSIDCVSARMARHIIKRLKIEVQELMRR